MVVAKARHACNGPRSILPAVKADKSKSLWARGRHGGGKKWVTGSLLSGYPVLSPASSPTLDCPVVLSLAK